MRILNLTCLNSVQAVLVTGVLGGVGSALREQFAKLGFYVIGTDILSDSRGSGFLLQFGCHESIRDRTSITARIPRA